MGVDVSGKHGFNTLKRAHVSRTQTNDQDESKTFNVLQLVGWFKSDRRDSFERWRAGAWRTHISKISPMVGYRNHANVLLGQLQRMKCSTVEIIEVRQIKSSKYSDLTFENIVGVKLCSSSCCRLGSNSSSSLTRRRTKSLLSMVHNILFHRLKCFPSLGLFRARPLFRHLLSF